MWASIVLALACLSHGIVLIYTAIGALVIVACRCGADLWRLLVSRIARDREARRRTGADLHGARRRRRWSASPCWSPRRSSSTTALVVIAFLPGVAARRGAVRRAPAGAGCPTSCSSSGSLYGAAVGGLTLLLAAFWVGPFLFNHDYMTDMKYGFKPDGGSESFWSMLFDQEPFLDVAHQHAGGRRAAWRRSPGATSTASPSASPG